jgi:hypothetical protein
LEGLLFEKVELIDEKGGKMARKKFFVDKMLTFYC